GCTHQYTELTSKEELDHGIMVPLYYIFKEIEVPIVSLAISYLGFEKHYSLGIAVRRASDILNRRAVYLASGDLSHRLTPGAPAGYNLRGEEFDNLLVNLVRTGDFAGLLSIDRDLAESAGECGLRPIISLAGLFNGYDVQTDVLSYEGPFGVGYLVSTVREKAPNRARDLLTDKSME
ncbi:MAG: AmmeMemoRadiSam system protein A, partial [Actinobacteria bacterium]|nr:AmmeMemoRadiSam system protein A [Actinomycetota bacterium]